MCEKYKPATNLQEERSSVLVEYPAPYQCLLLSDSSIVIQVRNLGRIPDFQATCSSPFKSAVATYRFKSDYQRKRFIVLVLQYVSTRAHTHVDYTCTVYTFLPPVVGLNLRTCVYESSGVLWYIEVEWWWQLTKISIHRKLLEHNGWKRQQFLQTPTIDWWRQFTGLHLSWVFDFGVRRTCWCCEVPNVQSLFLLYVLLWAGLICKADNASGCCVPGISLYVAESHLAVVVNYAPGPTRVYSAFAQPEVNSRTLQHERQQPCHTPPHTLTHLAPACTCTHTVHLYSTMNMDI